MPLVILLAPQVDAWWRTRSSRLTVMSLHRQETLTRGLIFPLGRHAVCWRINLIQIASCAKRIGLVGLAGVAVAAATAVLAFWARAPDETTSLEGRPPLALDAELTGVENAAELTEAEGFHQEGRADDALDLFESMLSGQPDSLEAAVGSAIARWPAGTTARLRTLALSNEESALVQFHLGLALFWEKREQAAINAWQRALEVEPNSPSALRAENLLFPDVPRGRPIFVPGTELDPSLRNRPLAEQLAALDAVAESAPSAATLIAHGVALQRAGRLVSAAERFEEAARLEPGNAEARVAAALVRFEKGDPTPAFAALGPLTTAFPDDAVVRYHLALALIWISDVAGAEEQLAQAAALNGDGFYEAQALTLLERIGEVSSGPGSDDALDGPS